MPNLTQRFNAIDHNQIASNRQIYAVAAHFANIQAGTPSDRFPLTKVFYAIIRKYYEQFDCKMTHGEATDYLENWQEVPEEFKSQLKAKPSPKKKKVAATKVANVTTSKPPLTAADVDARLAKLEEAVSSIAKAQVTLAEYLTIKK